MADDGSCDSSQGAEAREDCQWADRVSGFAEESVFDKLCTLSLRFFMVSDTDTIAGNRQLLQEVRGRSEDPIVHAVGPGQGESHRRGDNGYFFQKIACVTLK